MSEWRRGLPPTSGYYDLRIQITVSVNGELLPEPRQRGKTYLGVHVALRTGLNGEPYARVGGGALPKFAAPIRTAGCEWRPIPVPEGV